MNKTCQFTNSSLKASKKTKLVKKKQNLPFTENNWSVAELQINYQSKAKTDIRINSPEDAHKVFRSMWDKSLINIQEQVCAIFLKRNNEVVGFRVISTGKISSSTVDIQLLLSCALLTRSSGIIIAHNHPSGELKISAADYKMTRGIKEASKYLDINLLDHLILNDKSFISFANEDSI